MSFSVSPHSTTAQQKAEQLISRYAVDPGVLFVAAASNGGRNTHRTYPAKHESVLCINCTDGTGSWAESINPGRWTKSLNLCTLGEKVLGPYSSRNVDGQWEHGHKRSTGTSVATAVAAGIMALVLEFVRQGPVPKDNDTEKNNCANEVASELESRSFDDLRGLEWRVRTKQGMEKVLELMKDRREKDSGSLYLAPWNLLSVDAAVRGGSGSSLKEAVTDIAIRMRQALAS
jgi:hypothetical protein